MKYIKISMLLLAGFGAAQVTARPEDMPLAANYNTHRQTYDEIGVSLTDILSLLSHPVIAKNLWNGSLGIHEPAYVPPPPRIVSLTDYQAELPHKTQLVISRFEKNVLTAYLDKPTDVVLAKFLALYHLNGAWHDEVTDRGDALQHRIVSAYFLSRAKDLGAREAWVTRALQKTESKLESLAARLPGVALEETHAAHAQVHEAFFFNHEENRYKVQGALLGDYVAAPNNVYTALLNSTVNLWIAGEAGFDDPSVLYNFVIGSYFSVRAIKLAEQAEQAWRRDPIGHKRFRLGSTLGGFSVPLRRWMSKFHKDVKATQALDREHEEWRQINIAFHMLPVAWTLFEEDVVKSQDAFDEGFLLGLQRPELVSVQNRPRFTFNFMGTFMIGAELALKQGDVAAARGMWLATQPFLPNFADWALGEEGRAHLLAHAEEIAALYQNNDPKDDPLPFQLRRRKWGSNTISCQGCHEVQRKVWSEEEKNTIMIPPDDILTVETWPAISTTWYGASK